MCNAWNHPVDCDCGFGGDSGGGWAASSLPVAYRWDGDGDFCRPTTCPICRGKVFFVRHNGGSVWFDDLGPPWPKHGCFDDEPCGRSLRRHLRSVPETLFGVVATIEMQAAGPPRIVVRCSDGTMVEPNVRTDWDAQSLVGELVVVERQQDGRPNASPLDYRKEDFTRPIKCPNCGRDVFFVRHSRGTLWLQQLAHPWPEHPCFDEVPSAKRLRVQLASTPELTLGVVVDVQPAGFVRDSSGAGVLVTRVVVRSADGKIVDRTFKATVSTGELVFVEQHPTGTCALYRTTHLT